MATLEHLANSGKIKKPNVDLEDNEMPLRVIYLSLACDTWLVADLVPVARFAGRKLTPYEQVDQIFYEFVIGRPMAYSVDYRKLEPLTEHVWELKTQDARLFGWFAKKGHFVVVCAALKNQVRKFKDYAPFVAKVVAFRQALDLDEPKMITGVTHAEVL